MITFVEYYLIGFSVAVLAYGARELYKKWKRNQRGGEDYTLLGNPVSMETWVKWLIGLLVGVVVVVAIAVPVALLANKDSKDDKRATYTLEDLFGDKLRYTSFAAEWVSDNEFCFRTGDDLFLYNIDNDKTTLITSNGTLNGSSTFYSMSEDKKYMLIVHNLEKVWRHSYQASYLVYDIDKSVFIKTNALPDEVQYIAWSPVGHKLAYVWQYNIYIKLTPESESVQVTLDGTENKILNGIPDWVYEEEMFSTHSALWWSPNAKYVSYIQFNDTEVPLIEYSFYGPESEKYPQTIHIPYPKAGAKNPTVKLFTVNAETFTPITTLEILAPEEMRSIDHYIATVSWATDQRIAIQWLRRIQNVSLLTLCELDEVTPKWTCAQTVREESTTGWVGNFGPAGPVFASDKRAYYKIISNSDGFKHIHYFDGTKAPVAITSGKFEVISIVTLTSDFIYYISNEGYPSRRHIYKKRMGTDASTPTCITCHLRTERCQRYSPKFSYKSKYFILTCMGPGIPMDTLHQTSDDKEMHVMEDNDELRIQLEKLQMPTKVNKTISMHGFDLWYLMTLPPHFDKSKTYPLLIDVYGGPCSQKADQNFRLSWATYLASTEKIIVASFDGRGSGYQGDKILHQLNRRLGTVEVDDQIAAVGHFISLGFIDPKKIAIWGWSYGGYVASMALGAGDKLFKCGIAVAPVASWQYYDSIYTERYMGLPTQDDNLQSYLNSTVMSRVKMFQDVEYLLIHGTADDNVHFQQGAQISKALVDEQVDFETMWYTDKDHAISGRASQHLYTHMSHFLKKCFDLQ